MIDITKLYKEECENYEKRGYMCAYGYGPMIEAFGNIVIKIDDDDYQGDTRVLYNNDGRIGHLIFGWGSCSGCDALQACGTPEEVQELCNELEQDIKWFDSIKEALEWFESYDWVGNWYGHDENTLDYVQKAIKYLEGEVKAMDSTEVVGTITIGGHITRSIWDLPDEETVANMIGKPINDQDGNKIGEIRNVDYEKNMWFGEVDKEWWEKHHNGFTNMFTMVKED